MASNACSNLNQRSVQPDMRIKAICFLFFSIQPLAVGTDPSYTLCTGRIVYTF